MVFSVDISNASRRLTQSHENDYFNDRLNAQRLLSLISFALPLSLFLLYVASPNTSDTGSPDLLIKISITAIVIALFRLLYNWNKPRDNFYQFSCAVLDLSAIAAILIGYAYTYDVPISVALKSPTANLFFVFLASRIVLFSRSIIVKTGIAAALIWAGLTAIAIYEPGFTGRTSSYVEYLTSFKVLIGAEIERVLQFGLLTLILYGFVVVVQLDPATGFKRRPYFLQNLAKYLGQTGRKPTSQTHALIEVRIPTIVNDAKIYEAIFRLIPKLDALSDIDFRKYGRLSNRTIAIWLAYNQKKMSLDKIVDDLSDELSLKALNSLGSQTPKILVGASPLYKSATNHQILSYTDIAIKVASSMRKGAHVFEETDEAKILLRQKIEDSIRYALQDRTLYVKYQAIYDLMTDRPVGYEALVRLRDETGEEVSPGQFIPIAEETGLIDDVCERVCRLISQEAHGLLALNQVTEDPPYLNINISPHQLKNIDRTIGSLQCAKRSGLTINVEITESANLNDVEILEHLQRLRLAGFAFIIDDFGTGYSSLHRLRDLNVSTLKIDRAFVENIDSDGDFEFLDSIVRLGRTAADNVVIEGVETLQQKLLMMKMGVRYCQGYYFSKPKTLDTLLDEVRHGHERPENLRLRESG